ncbi:tetratricopeptide repeat protein [Rubripirellula amarantea]|uniref:Tetratricopeptide repeat protein n=1 Tax=Rubripirellula amarantea TaxID=2527999 RepID=A0A5C5WQM7_9BACT|nr:CRTAC1 family protein [Rubripirellula amarantea]TWT52760.1 tetratricopeptide repeat protein [Rubripirellula amarantea]
MGKRLDAFALTSRKKFCDPTATTAGTLKVASALLWTAGNLGLISWVGCAPSSSSLDGGRDHQKIETLPQASPNGNALGQSSELSGSSESSGSVERAMKAASLGDWKAAKRFLRSHLVSDPGNTSLQEDLARVAMQQGRTMIAIEFLQNVVDSNPDASMSIREDLAQMMMATGRPFETVAIEESLIERYPEAVDSRFALAGLAAMLGLDEVAVGQLRWLAQHKHGHFEGLVVLAQPSQVEPDSAMCEKLLQLCPEDQRAQYGPAKRDSLKLKWRQVADRLRPVVDQHPEFIPGYVLYGRALMELGKIDAMQDWYVKRPQDAQSSPQYWFVVGMWAEERGDHGGAARAYCEAALRQGANDSETLTHLIASLRRIGREDDVQHVAKRNEHLTQLHDLTKTLYERDTQSQKVAMQVAETMSRLGRVWEAEGWARFALTLRDDRLSDAKDRYLAIRSRLSPETPWDSSSVVEELKRQSLELPEISSLSSAPALDRKFALGNSKFLFADEAEARGLFHTTSLAPEANQQGHYIFQSNGGGAAVIDFDLDGWPDLTVADLNGKPMQEDSNTDRLFRNVNGSFIDITKESTFRDHGFSQGITVGDYNSDGFPDVLTGNIGQNRLFRNNGDGTFADVTETVGLTGRLWTTSMVIADIDGDGNADVFEVNYCGGNRPYERACRSREDNHLVACTPMDFEGEPDRVWAGLGDGTFEDVTAKWMKQSSPGRGLGLVAGHLDERPGLDVYVANDMSANHLWSLNRSDPGVADESTSLVEIAASRGLALSGRSLSQASMGIAVGDPDCDGDTDLFVTHFAGDHNTYYEQVGRGLWADRTYRAGLSEPSIDHLGFGIQWSDFDNDGTLELIIANGHVSDLDRSDVAYQMPPQLFRQTEVSQWAELPQGELGDYFSQDHLGRALLTMDANRDGRNDVVVTHLYEPVSLLMNHTRSASEDSSLGNTVGLVFVAKQSHRDAVGTTVQAKVGRRILHAQLTGGDGYMVSNQRRISLGIGNATEIESATITWPAGTQQTFHSLLSGRDYMLVEGDAEPTVLFDHSDQG